METVFFSPASLFHGDDSDDGRDEMQVDDEGEKQALEYVERVHKFPGMACYFANLLPVETASTVAVYDGNIRSGILVSERVDYPVKALVFIANNINTLVNVVSEVSFILHDNSTAYSLLISNNGTKVFLFPQVKNLVTGCSLSAWECSGYFVYHTKFDFDRVSEIEISNRMASVSLQDGVFEELKNLCCAIADDLAM